jgi:hypothetical protein
MQQHTSSMLGIYKRHLHCAAFFGIALSLVACRIEIIVPDGGQVSSNSGTYFCAENARCVIDVIDTHFMETFSASAIEGYTFAGWRKKDRGFCGGRRAPCKLSTKDFAGKESLLAILASNETFYLEPLIYPSNFSGTYRMTPSRQTQLFCGEGLKYYDPGQSFEFTALHLGDHLMADMIAGDEIPGASLVSHTVAISRSDFRKFAQRAVFSHPNRGLIDYYVVQEPHTSSNVGFSGAFYADYYERNSGRWCSITNYLRAEKIEGDPVLPDYRKIPAIAGSYELAIESAPITCSDGSSENGPGVMTAINLEQTGNMITFDNPARALVEARTSPSTQQRYAVGGRVNSSGELKSFGFSRIYYNSTVDEWTDFNATADGSTINGTIKLTHATGDGHCEETHAFTGYRTN